MIITLPWPSPILSPNSRAHWRQKAKATATYRRDCTIIAQGAGARQLQWAGMAVSLRFCPPDRRARDLDNMLAAMKAGLDGLASATGVDDSLWTITIAKGEPLKGGAVEVSIAPRGV